MRDGFLPGLIVLVWVASWWGPRRFRLWLALLLPIESVAAIVLAYSSVPPSSCEHGCVVGWADSVDGSEGVAGALLTFPVALAISAITGIVELILFVSRNSSEPELVSGSPDPEDPSWDGLTRGPSRD